MVCLELPAVAVRRQHSWPTIRCLAWRTPHNVFNGLTGVGVPQKILIRLFNRLGRDDCDSRDARRPAGGCVCGRKVLSWRRLRGSVIGGKVAWSSDPRGVALRMKVNRRRGSEGQGACRHVSGIRLPMSNARSIELPQGPRPTPDRCARSNAVLRIVRCASSHAKPQALVRRPCGPTMWLRLRATTAAAARTAAQ